MKKKTYIPLIIIGVIIVAALLLSSSIFITVPTGHTGVVTTFGKVEDYVLDEGVHMKLPWQNVVKMDNRAQKESLNLQAFSSDIQQVDVVCSVNFSVDRETSQNLYRNVGAYYYDTVMLPRIQECLKSVFAKFSAENLVAERATLSMQISDLLSPEMKTYGIEIISVSVENIDFTDVFTDAVEAKQVAEQSKLQAQIEQEQKVMEAMKEAERMKIAADAAAEVKKIEADAAAYAVEVAAQAEAEANEKLARSITESLIKYNEIQQWNGELPYLYSGENGGFLPILEASGRNGQSSANTAK